MFFNDEGERSFETASALILTPFGCVEDV